MLWRSSLLLPIHCHFTLEFPRAGGSGAGGPESGDLFEEGGISSVAATVMMTSARLTIATSGAGGRRADGSCCRGTERWLLCPHVVECHLVQRSLELPSNGLDLK